MKRCPHNALMAAVLLVIPLTGCSTAVPAASAVALALGLVQLAPAAINLVTDAVAPDTAATKQEPLCPTR